MNRPQKFERRDIDRQQKPDTYIEEGPMDESTRLFEGLAKIKDDNDLLNFFETFHDLDPSILLRTDIDDHIIRGLMFYFVFHENVRKMFAEHDTPDYGLTPEQVHSLYKRLQYIDLPRKNSRGSLERCLRPSPLSIDWLYKLREHFTMTPEMFEDIIETAVVDMRELSSLESSIQEFVAKGWSFYHRNRTPAWDVDGIKEYRGTLLSFPDFSRFPQYADKIQVVKDAIAAVLEADNSTISECFERYADSVWYLRRYVAGHTGRLAADMSFVLYAEASVKNRWRVDEERKPYIMYDDPENRLRLLGIAIDNFFIDSNKGKENPAYDNLLYCRSNDEEYTRRLFDMSPEEFSTFTRDAIKNRTVHLEGIKELKSLGLSHPHQMM